MITTQPRFCTPKVVPFIPFGASHQISQKGKQWANGERIDISFLDGTEEQARMVMRESMEWEQYANLKFQFVVNSNNADVRISFKHPGAWSYVGTDAMFINNKEKPTMNFGFYDSATIKHEFGHMVGLQHEHQHPDKPFEWNRLVVLEDMKKQGWSLSVVERNIFNVFDEKEKLIMREFDVKSIMQYFFPASWTKNGIHIEQNTEISEGDKKMMKILYPFPVEVDADAYFKAFQGLCDVYNAKEVGRLYIRTHKKVLSSLGVTDINNKREAELIKMVQQNLSSFKK